MKKELSQKERRAVIKSSPRGQLIEKLGTLVILYVLVCVSLVVLSKISNSSSDVSQVWQIAVPATLLVFFGYYVRFDLTLINATDCIRKPTEEEIEKYIKENKPIPPEPKKIVHTKPPSNHVYY